ncbi:MAG: hypothetical protein OXI66_16410 [Boseongicola sp.]|nr:hypothetical protein [Boseongicola sp.]
MSPLDVNGDEIACRLDIAAVRKRGQVALLYTPVARSGFVAAMGT